MTKIAKKLLKKNPDLAKLAKSPKAYKAIEAGLDGALMKAVGEKVGHFVKKHDFIWCLINVANGNVKQGKWSF